MPAGDLKMPDPIVDPISTAMALHRPSCRRRVGAGVALMGAAYAAGCRAATQLPLLSHIDELSLQGCRSIEGNRFVACNPDSMIATTIFWVAVVLCVIAHRYILRSAFAAGAAVQHSHTLPPIRRAAEVVWVVVPAVALVFLFIATWRAIEARRAPAPVPAVTAQAAR